MTLDEALAKVDRQMDDIFDRVLLDAEKFIRDLGGTDDECAAWLHRKREELADTRKQIHEMVSVLYWTGGSTSSRLH